MEQVAVVFRYIGSIGNATGAYERCVRDIETAFAGLWCTDLESNGWRSLEGRTIPWLPYGGRISGVRSQAFGSDRARRRLPMMDLYRPIAESCFILRPVRHPEVHLANMMATADVTFMRHARSIALVSIRRV
ncbi:conserved hypothetical protein [Ricinus communis]|uniref:Uncharacterized protein n=1 Tax=Ricinus communis TaxID=3988 RepID=B9TMS9_RICCO|nr:conserved hypothetical protein [Ricinus communis]